MVVKLAVRGGTFGYGDRILFENVSIETEERGVLTVLGPNGAGKTSFLKCIMGMNRWTSGMSELEGRDIASMSPKELTRHVAYVPQMLHHMFTTKRLSTLRLVMTYPHSILLLLGLVV